MFKKKKLKTVPSFNEDEIVYSCNEKVSEDEFAWVGQDKNKMNGIARESVSYLKDALTRLRKDKIAMTLIILLAFILLMAIFVPMLSPFTIEDQHLQHTNKGMFYVAEGHMHIFGTDSLGRDAFTRVWDGGRISLIIAFSAVAINCLIGIVYGGISGYFGGAIDNIMMRIVEIVNGIPYLLIIILLMTIMPPGIGTIILAYSLVGWVGMARLVRGQIIQLKEQEFVVSAQTMGASASRILSKHLIPNILSIIIVNLTLAIPSAIFTEAYLSFIGLGVPVPQASWGTLANDGIINFQNYPEQLLIPGFFISITMLGFNLLGDKLRDAFDPKLRR